MKKLIGRAQLVAAITAALVAGCAKNDSQAPTADIAAGAPTETAEQSVVINAMPFEGIEIELGSEANEPLVLPVAQKISGEFTAPQAGTYERLGVLIGTYFDSSDGDLHLELCSGETCSAGTASVKGTPDNDFLGVQLEPELIVPAGGALRYTIERVSGEKPLAIWMYPKGEVFAKSTGVDGTTLETAPKLKVGIRP